MYCQFFQKQTQLFLLALCVLIMVGSAESKDLTRVFTGQVVYVATKHGVADVVIRLRPIYESDSEGAESGAVSKSPAGGSLCPSSDICETAGHNGKFAFHQIKTGLYDLQVYKDGQMLYQKPQPLVIPVSPGNTDLVVFVPQPLQNEAGR
jgi:hypothetical protein